MIHANLVVEKSCLLTQALIQRQLDGQLDENGATLPSDGNEIS